MYAIIFFDLKDQISSKYKSFQVSILWMKNWGSQSLDTDECEMGFERNVSRHGSLFYFTKAGGEGTFRYKEITLENIVS